MSDPFFSPYKPSYMQEAIFGLNHFTLNNMENTSNQDTYIRHLHDNRAALHSALVNAIAETQAVQADSTNPFHKNKYASLGAHLDLIKPVFAKHGLAVVQFPTSSEKAIGVTTIIIHKDGSQIMDTICIPVGENVKGQDAGSVISYLRRYALAAVAGVSTDDDDAESDRVIKATYTSGVAPVSKASYQPVIPNPSASKAVTGEVDFNLQVPFGKNKGSTLNDLPLSDLDYWANKWEPKPWEKTGKVGAKDLALKSSAQALWAIKSTSGNENEDVDQVPF